ncbi:MAG: DUF3857 domain-containing protein [Candidatus Eisenbacteria bacterium]|nr:DUF3857 domain-containing protein [Candidatus Eisenbacteria bacterium]
MRHPERCLGGILVAFVLAVLAPPATAALEPLDLDDAAAMLAEAGGLDEHPNANSLVVLDETYVEFDESGAYESYFHSLTKILTDEGIDQNADEAVSYHAQYGTVEIILARVIKADGTEIVVGEDLITDGTPPQIAAMNIYETNFRVKTVVFPNLEVGDAVEVVYHEEYEPLLDNEFNGIYFLRYVEPMLLTKVTIRGPSDMPLRHVVKDGEAEFVEREDGGDTVYEWTVRNSPKLEREMGMAPFAQVATRLLVSTVESWEELSRYAWKLSDEKCVAEQSVKDVVEEVTAGLTTTEEKIRAIHYWIIENVRYLGIAMDRSMFLEPHYAAYTLEKEYGVCRDKAVLMVTMLEEIGVPAWVVFINPSKETDTEIPTVYFEHGIVAIKGDDGGYKFIDPTMEMSRTVYASYVGDRWVLVATEEGEDIQQAPHVPASANSGVITEESTLAEDGSLTGDVTITGRGMYEEILRTIASQAGPEQIRMMAENMIQSVRPGASLDDFSVSDYEDLHQPLTIELTYSIDDYALDAEPYRLFRVPIASGSFDILSDALFGRFVALEERECPIALGVTLGVQEEGIVYFPAGYEVRNFPDDVEFEEGIVSLVMRYDMAPSGEAEKPAVTYERMFGLDYFQVYPEDYQSLKEAVRLAGRSSRGEVILMKKEG